MNLTNEEARHPFLEGLSKHRGAPPTVIVIFGASGDLTARKLVPAIFNLGLDNLLPGEFHLIGYGRKPIKNDEFRKIMDEAICTHSRRSLNKEVWERVRLNTSYHTGGYDEPAAFELLAKKIGEESSELIIDFIKNNKEGVIKESADLIYHVLVVWVSLGINPEEIWKELYSRKLISGIEEKKNRGVK